MALHELTPVAARALVPDPRPDGLLLVGAGRRRDLEAATVAAAALVVVALDGQVALDYQVGAR